MQVLAPEISHPVEAPASTRIRVVIVDNHPIVLLGLAKLLESERDIKVIAECTNADQAVSAISRLHPDVALLDTQMPGAGGLEILEALAGNKTGTRTVLLTNHMTQEQFLRAMALDVRGIVLKTMPLPLVVRCVRLVHAGQQFIEKDMLLRAFSRFLRGPSQESNLASELTTREMVVAQLTVVGLSNKQVAIRLKISEGTVKAHLHRAFDKLGVRNRVALINRMRERGLANPAAAPVGSAEIASV